MKFQQHPFHHRKAESKPDTATEPTEEQSEGDVKRESEFLRHLTDEQTPVVIHLISGEQFQGVIEYYDRRFIRLTRQGAPNLFIYKHDIKYLREQ